MWTGNKVIPEIITRESIEELGQVLKRKPVIWDNIHANDYDQRRVFLGAYCGRPIELYPLLNGILTNPNCEFEANYIPIHTLGTWCRVADNVYSRARSISESDGEVCVPMFDDVAMDDLSDDDDTSAVAEECVMPVDLAPLTAADVAQVVGEYNPRHALHLALLDWLEEFRLHKKAPLKSYSKRNLKTTIVNGQTVLTATPYDLDITNAAIGGLETLRNDKHCIMELNEESLILLTDLFCLPYGHGDKGLQLQQEFMWLLQNVGDIMEKPPSKEKISCWYDRLLKCEVHCQAVYDLFASICKIPNEAILYDLYPYLWDLKEVVLSLDTYVHWLSNFAASPNLINEKFWYSAVPSQPLQAPKFIANDYIEPWHIMYLGGLTLSLHNMMPFKGGYLFLDSAPDTPRNDTVQIRCYSNADREALYQLCALEDTEELIDIDKIDLPGDREIGAYLSVCPKTLFTVEDKSGVCGYVAAAPDNQHFHDCATKSWLPEMKSKYVDGDCGSLPYSDFDGWKSDSSSHVTIRLNSRVRNPAVLKRVFSSVLSVLKSTGSQTVYYQLSPNDDMDLFTKLGFRFVENVEVRIAFRAL